MAIPSTLPKPLVMMSSFKFDTSSANFIEAMSVSRWYHSIDKTNKHTYTIECIDRCICCYSVIVLSKLFEHGLKQARLPCPSALKEFGQIHVH